MKIHTAKLQAPKRAPIISVITICYNAEKFIGTTFDSVRIQSVKKGFEYIVIDGGSTDRTLNIINHNKDIIDYCNSEPDEGIADAMNKGILRSKGKYILFLHSDDYFVGENTMDGMVDAVSSGEDIVVFDIFFEKKGGRTLIHPRKFNFYTNFKLPFCHQAVLCRRSLFDQVGGFDKAFRITMDYDFFLRAYKAKASCKIIPETWTVFRDTGVSSRVDKKGLSERFREERKAHFKNCDSFVLYFLYMVWWALYAPYREFKNKIRVF